VGVRVDGDDRLRTLKLMRNRRLAILALSGLIGTTVIIAATRAFARCRLFPGSSVSEEAAADDVVVDWTSARDGAPVRALELLAPSATRTIVHGDADEIVPFWMGEELSRVIPFASLLRVNGGHHSDLLSRDGARVLSEIVTFGR
jgi:pimeloyl-ACP methyl ester carboxylesterase